MSWLDASARDLPRGLAEWAARHSSAAAARAECPRADWLLWLLLDAASSEQIQRYILHAAAFAVERSPALRSASARVAPVHVWGAPSPHDRPPRPFRMQLVIVALVATIVLAVVDFLVTSRLTALLLPASRAWARSAGALVVWIACFQLVDGLLDRRAARLLDARARAMTVSTARSIVMAALARAPEDPRALKDLREADAQWFRSTTL